MRLPMKKTSTHKQQTMNCKTSSPSFKTLQFLRQFARSYRSVEVSERGLCGVCLN